MIDAAIGAVVTDGLDKGRIIAYQHRYITDRQLAPLIQWDRRGFISFAVTPLRVIEPDPPAFNLGDRVVANGQAGTVYYCEPPADQIWVEVGTTARPYHPDQLCPAEQAGQADNNPEVTTAPPDQIVKVWRRFNNRWIYTGITGYTRKMIDLKPGDLLLPVDALPEEPKQDDSKPPRKSSRRKSSRRPRYEQLSFL